MDSEAFPHEVLITSLPPENNVVEVDETERIANVPIINNDWQRHLPPLPESIFTSTWNRQQAPMMTQRIDFLQALNFLRPINAINDANVEDMQQTIGRIEQRVRRINSSARRFLHIMESRYLFQDGLLRLPHQDGLLRLPHQNGLLRLPTETQPPHMDFRLLDLQYVLGRHFTFDVSSEAINTLRGGEQRQTIVAENDVVRDFPIFEILTPSRPRGFAIVDDMQDGVEIPQESLRIRNLPFITVAQRRSGRTHEIQQILRRWANTVDDIGAPLTNQQLNDFHRASQSENNRQNMRINSNFDGDEMQTVGRQIFEDIERQAVNRMHDILFFNTEFGEPRLFKKHANYADYCLLCETPSNELECSICLENYQQTDTCVLANFCGHIFHRQCLEKWIDESDECPLCRQNMLKKKTTQIQRRFPDEESVEYYEFPEINFPIRNEGEWHGMPISVEEID
jgi:hypothetical protein